MIILTIRTDKPEAEIGLFEDNKKLVYETWQAHRLLAETLHHQIAKNLQFVGKEWEDIEGVAVFKGPGSFTGLRIGLSLGNSLANALDIPIVGTNDEDWVNKTIKKLLKSENDEVVLPEYGSPVYTTKPKN